MASLIYYLGRAGQILGMWILLVDVVTARQELSIPPAITVEQAKGFSLYAIRTILAGRGDELLDLITTNVARRILD